MEAISDIAIDATEVRSKPDQHVAYRIAIRGPVRGWHVWKRYSEFDTLHNTLSNAFPLAGPPPTTLPPKTFSFLLNPFGATPDDPKKVQERRKGLERYLVDIVRAPDNRWRTHPSWYDFLAVPDAMRLAAAAGPRPGTTAASTFTTKSAPTPRFDLGFHQNANATPTLSPDAWMEEYRSVLAYLQEIRSFVSARDRHAANNDITASQMAAMQGKKGMAAMTTRVMILEESLKGEERALNGGPAMLFGLGPSRDTPASSTPEGSLGKGELMRRQDLLVNLREERDLINKLLNTSPTKHVANAPDPSDRAALFSFGKAESSPDSGGSSRSAVLPARTNRRFGVEQRPPPAETDITRPLDNQGLVQLQRQTMVDQEDQILALSTVIQRQKHIGMQIGNELEVHNQMLDELDQGVTRVQSHLKSATKKLDVVTRS